MLKKRIFFCSCRTSLVRIVAVGFMFPAFCRNCVITLVIDFICSIIIVIGFSTHRYVCFGKMLYHKWFHVFSSAFFFFGFQFNFLFGFIGYARMVLAVIAFYFMQTHYILAGWCYIVSALLDAIDGHAARAFNQSEFNWECVFTRNDQIRHLVSIDCKYQTHTLTRRGRSTKSIFFCRHQIWRYVGSIDGSLWHRWPLDCTQLVLSKLHVLLPSIVGHWYRMPLAIFTLVRISHSTYPTYID